MENSQKRLKFKNLIGFVLVFALFAQVLTVKGDLVWGYSYSKILALDYFTIANAFDDLNYTCVEGDFIYILNDTKLQKISLFTSLVVEEISYPLLTEPFEFLRKADRIFFDATINAVRTIVCVDISTFSELAQVARSKLASNFTRGLENLEYFDCDDHDIWSWAYAFSPVSNGQRLYPNIMRGVHPWNSTDMQWAAIFGVEHEPIVGAGGDFIIVQYFYNGSADSESNFTWNKGATTANFGHWFIADSFFNTSNNNNSWAAQSSTVLAKNTRIGANADNQMNLQYEFDGDWLSASWGEWGVRDNPNFESALVTYLTDDLMIWLDTPDRVMYYRYDPTVGTAAALYARFDRASGFITYITGKFMNTTNLGEDYGIGSETWGKMALGRYSHNYYGVRTWVAYCNRTDNFPKAEFVLEVGGTFNLECGTVEFEYPDVNRSRVFKADLNFVAIFTIDSDTDDLYVCRNLIDRNVLSTNGYYTPTVSLDDSELYESDGVTVKTDGWLYMGEVYEFHATVTNTTVGRFELSDGFNNMSFVWQNASNTMWIEADNELTIGLVGSSWTNTVNETYSLVWRFILNKNVVDCQNVNLTYTLTDPDGFQLTGYAVTGLHIYNLGGFTNYVITGDAGRVTAGDAFEVWAENHTGSGASAQAEVTWRRLQHINLIWGLDVEDNDCFDHHEQTGQVTFGLQYLEGGTWKDLIYGVMEIVDGAVDPDSGVGKAWITAYVNWYSRADTGIMTSIRTSYMSAYTECGDEVDSDVTHIRFYSDVWFNKMNGSTTLGIRLSPMFYGMEESGGFLVWGNWSPITFNATSTMAFADLRNSTGDLIQPHEVELVKFYVKVEKVALGVSTPSGYCDSHMWRISQPQVSYNRAEDRMQAIDTPDGVEPLVPDMPNTSFMSGITKAIQGISSMIWGGALNFIKILWSSMDTIFQFVGFPAGTFAKISDFVLSVPSYMITLIGEVPAMLVSLGTQVSRVFGIIAVGVPQFLWATGLLATNIIAFWTQLVSFFTGGWSGMSNMWSNLSLGEWIELFVILVLPSMWLNRVFSAKDSFKTAREDVKFVFDVYLSLLKFGTWLISTIALIIQAIRNVLPI